MTAASVMEEISLQLNHLIPFRATLWLTFIGVEGRRACLTNLLGLQDIPDVIIFHKNTSKDSKTTN